MATDHVPLGSGSGKAGATKRPTSSGLKRNTLRLVSMSAVLDDLGDRDVIAIKAECVAACEYECGLRRSR
jgi:hypothetical protein